MDQHPSHYAGSLGTGAAVRPLPRLRAPRSLYIGAHFTRWEACTWRCSAPCTFELPEDRYGPNVTSFMLGFHEGIKEVNLHPYDTMKHLAVYDAKTDYWLCPDCTFTTSPIIKEPTIDKYHAVGFHAGREARKELSLDRIGE